MVASMVEASGARSEQLSASISISSKVAVSKTRVRSNTIPMYWLSKDQLRSKYLVSALMVAPCLIKPLS